MRKRFPSLPPENEIWGKVMPLHLCIILFGGGEGDLHLGVGQTPFGYYDIWSMSGQYASYWNAFLFYPLLNHHHWMRYSSFYDFWIVTKWIHLISWIQVILRNHLYLVLLRFHGKLWYLFTENNLLVQVKIIHGYVISLFMQSNTFHR